MKSSLLFLALVSFLPSSLLGQEIICDGVVTSYSKAIAPQSVKNINFFADGDMLTLRSVLPDFPDEFRNTRFVMSRMQGLVTLKHQENQLFTGGINRHTGEILLLLRTPDLGGQLHSMFSGICEPAKINPSSPESR
jgi:hypothetical protein